MARTKQIILVKAGRHEAGAKAAAVQEKAGWGALLSPRLRRPLFLGIALMAYGYFVSNPWVSLAIGSVLTLLLFFPR